MTNKQETYKSPLNRELFHVEVEWLFRVQESVDDVFEPKMAHLREQIAQAKEALANAEQHRNGNPRWAEVQSHMRMKDSERIAAGVDIMASVEEAKTLDAEVQAVTRMLKDFEDKMRSLEIDREFAYMKACYLFGTAKGAQGGFHLASDMMDPGTSWAEIEVREAVALATRIMTCDGEAAARAACYIEVLNEDFERRSGCEPVTED